jgi:4-diphosphocytidyl-2-C-methyl-D-erythritol kinase
MKIERIDAGASIAQLRCQVPCKLNLFLDVIGKRADGYHDLDTVMLAVDLCDTLTIRTRANDGAISLRVDTPMQSYSERDEAWDVPSDERNLVVRALNRLRAELGTGTGADVVLRKRIPAQAGLGGGSADAAAALVIGSLAWSHRLQWSLVCGIARELGSDLNFFLEGWQAGRWTARCTGRGEQVHPVANRGVQHFVIVHPPQGCDTAKIFRNLTDQSAQSLQPSTAEERNSMETLACLARGDNEQLGKILYNRLELAASLDNPWIDRTARWFDRYNPLGQCLSGSGSARFCLCSDDQEAEKIGNELTSLEQVRVFVASTWQTPSIQEQVSRLGLGE